MAYYVYMYQHPVHGKVYIGRTKNLVERIKSHNGSSDDNISRDYEKMLKESEVYYMKLQNTAQGTCVEAYLIDKYSPMINKALKCDEESDPTCSGIEMKLPEWIKYDDRDFVTKKKPKKKPDKISRVHVAKKSPFIKCGEYTKNDYIDVDEWQDWIYLARGYGRNERCLNTRSAKIFRYVVSQICKMNEVPKTYTINRSEISKALNIKESSVSLDVAANCIMTGSNFHITKRKHYWVTMGFVGSCHLPNDSDFVEIHFTDDFHRIVGKRHRIKYQFKEIALMKSIYSIYLFELLLSYKNERQYFDVELPAERILYCLGLDHCGYKYEKRRKNYNLFSNFKFQVLDIAVNEINEKTSYSLSYEWKREESGIYSAVLITFHMRSKQC